MSNISVAEILKIHGRWIETTGLAALVADKLRITERHAYNKIKKAWENKEILKVELPNRSGVLCGLAEFGPLPFKPSLEEKAQVKTLNFQDAFFYDCFKKLEKIGDLNTRNSRQAMLQVRSLLMRLPEELREELMPSYLKAEKRLWQKWNKEVIGFRPPLTGAPQVDYMVREISDLLHSQLRDRKVAMKTKRTLKSEE